MHTHTYRCTGTTLLGLPVQGYADRIVHFACTTCGQGVTFTGELQLGTPLSDPAWWERQQAQERRRPTAVAQAAKRGQTWQALG